MDVKPCIPPHLTTKQSSSDGVSCAEKDETNFN